MTSLATDLKVHDVMTRNVVTIPPEDSVEKAARVMVNFGISSLIVESGKQVLGIITERDVLTRVVASGRNPRDVKVSDIMTSSMIVANQEMPIIQANETMLKNRIKKLPVVDKKNSSKVLGIISMIDIAKVLPEQKQIKKLVESKVDDNIDDIHSLLMTDEGQHLEFKASLRFDMNKKCANTDLEIRCLKTVCAFLNAEGGSLLIGVSDNKDILGLNLDYQTLKKSNRDGFENYLVELISTKVGNPYLKHIKFIFHEVDRLEVCQVKVTPSTEPAFLRHKNKQDFYVRTGNNSRPFKISDAAIYLRDRWK